MLTEPRAEATTRDHLEAHGFGAFLPMVATEVRHARRREVVMRPMFPRYLFARFDAGRPGWERAYRLRGLGLLRVMGPRPEAPTPLPPGVIERLQAGGWARPIAEAPAMLVEAGAAVLVQAGPFADHRGVCLWDDGHRVAVLMHLLGRSVRAVMPHGQAVPA